MQNPDVGADGIEKDKNVPDKNVNNGKKNNNVDIEIKYKPIPDEFLRDPATLAGHSTISY